MKHAFAASLLVLAAALARADDDALGLRSQMETVRGRFARFKDLEMQLKEAEAARDRAKASGLASKCAAAYDEFEDGFSKVAWDAWNAAGDADVVAAGLDAFGKRAFSRRDFGEARRAYEALLAKLPEHRDAAAVRARSLPDALLASGDVVAAAAAAGEAVPKLAGEDKADALLRLGDAVAVQGRFEEAASAWLQAARAFPELDAIDASSSGGRARQFENEIELRRFVGAPAPDLTAADCFGASAAAVSKFGGRVVVAFVFNPTALGDRGATPAIERLQTQVGGRGIDVVGFTSFERLSVKGQVGVDVVDSRLPKGPETLDDEPIKVTRKELRKYLVEWHKRMRTTFPLAMADEKLLSAVTRTPYGSAILVVDGKGVVVAAQTAQRVDPALGLARAALSKSFQKK